MAKSVNIDGLQLPNIVLVRGVPGCGKTKDIVDAHKRETPSEKGDLILSSSAENTQELRERSERPDDRVNYRTTHSYILNAKGKEREYKRVFIDEALMLHAGEIVLIAALSKCNELILMGDLFQIPYINRYTGLKIMRPRDVAQEMLSYSGGVNTGRRASIQRVPLTIQWRWYMSRSPMK